MDRSAIEKIEAMSKPNIVSENGYSYSDKNLNIISVPTVETVSFNTLRGLVETLKREQDCYGGTIIVNVKGYNMVEVLTAINEADRSREYPYVAKAETTSFDFGRKLDYESMIIALKSKFVETEELLNVVQLLGNITNEQSAQTLDDGFTQNVVVKKGIALKENKNIKPIVKLIPYRTFLEVGQPESEFLLRLHDGNTVALYEADGGAWKLEARRKIADYLRRELVELISERRVLVTE